MGANKKCNFFAHLPGNLLTVMCYCTTILLFEHRYFMAAFYLIDIKYRIA